MKRKILLVEDNEQNRYLASFLLQSQGYSVVSAVDGLEGLRLAGEVHPDIILLDIHLPKLDGLELARSFRKVRALSRTPIIAVTSHAMVGDREKCLEAGCSGYIEKPIDPERFVGQIEALSDLVPSDSR